MDKKKTIQVLSIGLLSVTLLGAVTGSIILKSGRDGINGKDGKANSVLLDDGAIAIDGERTPFGNVSLSGLVNVASNDTHLGTVSGSGRYPINAAVSLSASPSKGCLFSHWENEEGAILSFASSFLIQATEAPQSFLAVFEIDRSDAKIEVHARGDASLPSDARIEGEGTYKYGKEYTLSVKASSTTFEEGTFLYFEVDKNDFEDLSYRIDFSSTTAVAYGSEARFDVSDIFDKYYLIAYQAKKDMGWIDVVASASLEVLSSHPDYGKASLYKVNGKEYKEGESLVFPGDEVTLQSTPLYLPRYRYIPPEAGDKYKIMRSDFLYWMDDKTKEILSYDREYSFLAKQESRLIAVFSPKCVVHLEGYGITANLISSRGSYVRSYDNIDEINDPIESFYPKEEVLLYCQHVVKTSDGLTNRSSKLYFEISYDGSDYELLGYEKEVCFTIPSNCRDIYIRAVVDNRRD